MIADPHPDLKVHWHPIHGNLIDQKLNGDCIYVTDEGCSIHDTEMFPKECAEFDCRDNISPFTRPQENWEAIKRLEENREDFTEEVVNFLILNKYR